MNNNIIESRDNNNLTKTRKRDLVAVLMALTVSIGSIIKINDACSVDNPLCPMKTTATSVLIENFGQKALKMLDKFI